MLEMAEGTVWGSTTALKIANCVYSEHKAEEGQYSIEIYSHRSAYLEQGARRRQFEEESSRAFTRELTRSSVEVLCCKC